MTETNCPHCGHPMNAIEQLRQKLAKAASGSEVTQTYIGKAEAAALLAALPKK